MNMIEKFKEKWRKKTIFAKVTDIFFYLLIIAVIIPATRVEVMGFVNRIRAAVVQPSVKSEKEVQTLSDNDYRWQLYKSDGTSVDFSQMKGKVVFLNFWATWCPPCIGEMPDIEELYKKFEHNPNVVFCLVTSDDKTKVAEFLKRKKYSFPVYFSGSEVPAQLSSNSLPTTFLISKTGKILIKEIGASNWGGDKMEKVVNDLAKE